MMNGDDYRHFVCIVAGDNPSSLMEPYNRNIKVNPYIVYKYDDAAMLKQQYIEQYQLLFDNETNEGSKKLLKKRFLI